ncbi:MAG: hypothetical protein WD750_06100 [Gammaproteobacteria bacterium]
MSDPQAQNALQSQTASLDKLTERFDRALERMDQARPFAKASHANEFLEAARRLLVAEGGVDYLAGRIEAIDRAGAFYQTDWADPNSLQPDRVPWTLAKGNQQLVTLECLSELRWLAIARGEYSYPGISREQALHFLREVLALNLDFVFERQTEAARSRHQRGVQELFRYLVGHVGYGDILEQVVEEVWRILKQRPIHLSRIIDMVTQLAVCVADPNMSVPMGSERLVSALYGPTQSSQDDPGLDVYRERLQAMDAQTLQQEALSFSRAMHDTGLVSSYHSVLLRFLLENEGESLIAQTLGLSNTGHDVYLSYRDLINRLISDGIFPETCQAVYGLACLLERGILYDPALAPNLWRLIVLPLHPQTEQELHMVYGTARPARAQLIAGALQMMGLPFGVGQGDNPTCQSARALSMWAFNDPDYLMQLLAWAARDREIIMHFEGKAISSRNLQAGLSDKLVHTDLDPVSLILVPHLDRIYMEMGRMSVGRGEDPHKWVNPEFHGWWVGHAFAIAVDVATGRLENYETFLRDFYASYHPYYNGNKPVIHPQPAGIAITESNGEFIGWHAITIIRVALDRDDEVRVYFYNPNNDGGQNWGCGVVVSTEGHGEFHGESSLPVAQFASRLYIFHYDPLEKGDTSLIDNDELAAVIAMARESWAKERV